MTEIYRAAHLLASPTGGRVDDGCVMVDCGKIVYAGSFLGADGGHFQNDSEEIRHFGDATILPGLIDAHVHLVWSASSSPHELVEREPRAVTAIRALLNAQGHLDSGVTTVRDVGSTDAIAVDVGRAIDAGIVAGPHIQAAGRAIAMTGGHARWIAKEADGPTAVRQAVRAEIKGGARCIKVMASGGIYGQSESIGSPQLRLEELRAAAEAAHDAGLRITAHAYSTEAIQNALDADVDSIEHGSFLSPEQAMEMSDRGVFLVPTLSVYRAMAEGARRLDLSEHVRAKTEEVLKVSEVAFRTALAAGVPIATGTDAGSPGHPHSGALAAELLAMVEAGATPYQALIFATARAAELLQMLDTIGTLERGKQADFTIVAGDATGDISRVKDVMLTIKGGVPHTPHGAPTLHSPSVYATAVKFSGAD